MDPFHHVRIIPYLRIMDPGTCIPYHLFHSDYESAWVSLLLYHPVEMRMQRFCMCAELLADAEGGEVGEC